MTLPTEIAGIFGLIIFGGLFALVGIGLLIAAALAHSSTLAVIACVPLGLACLCGFRLWQEDRYERERRR